MNTTTKTKPSGALILTVLPGSDRKRSPSMYTYRVSYRNPHPEESGCLMLWNVQGGRMEYQVALERTESGKFRWHCTCADAIYRSDVNPKHTCKHVQGVMECLPVEENRAA
jgi:hypothetical protein